MVGLKLIWILLATTPQFVQYAPQTKERYEEQFETGQYTLTSYIGYKQLCFQTQDYDGLIQTSQKLIERVPGEAEPYFGLAEGYFFLKKKSEGRAVLDKLYKRNPEMTLRIGATLERFEFFKEEIDYYERYRRLKKSDAYLSEELIRAYEFSDDYHGAAVEIVRLIDRTPGSAPAYERFLASLVGYTDPKGIINEVKKMKSETDRARLLSRIYLQLKDYRAASSEFKKSGSKNELSEFARLCVEAGAFQPALEVYQKLNRRLEQGQCLRKLGRFEEAAVVLSKDESLPAQLELADIYRVELKDPKRAQGLYRSILATAPGYKPAESGLVAAFIQSGELKPAQAMLLKISAPADWVLFDKIEIGFFEGEFDSISNYALQLSRSFPESPLLNDGLELAVLSKETDPNLKEYGQALFQYESGNYDQAVDILKKIIDQGSGLADDSYLLVARSYRAKKEAGSALAALAELEKKFPSNPVLARMRLEKALIYLEDLKDLKTGQKTLGDLIVSDPDTPQAVIARNLLSFNKM